jgi:hypothetical protein
MILDDLVSALSDGAAPTKKRAFLVVMARCRDSAELTERAAEEKRNPGPKIVFLEEETKP